VYEKIPPKFSGALAHWEDHCVVGPFFFQDNTGNP